MDGELEIVANNGKVYRNMRAYHIAMGHAVRSALLDFCKEIEDYCKDLMEGFYAEYTPMNYERDYQLLDKMKLGQLIKAEVKGSFEKNYDIEMEVFDWTVLDSHSNPYGLGTFQDYDGTDSRSLMEDYLMGDIKGHEGIHLNYEVKQYIDKHLDERVQKVLNDF